MPQRMLGKKEECFWLGQDLESGKVLELGVLPEDVQMEEVGERVTWRPALEPPLEGQPLAPSTEALNKESGSAPVQEDGATVDDNAVM